MIIQWEVSIIPSEQEKLKLPSNMLALSFHGTGKTPDEAWENVRAKVARLRDFCVNLNENSLWESGAN